MISIASSKKTTYCDAKVNDWASKGFAAECISADDYPGLYVNGVLDVGKLQFAHDDCYERVRFALEEDKKVFLDNTNIEVQHWRRYIELCANMGVPVFFHFPINTLFFYVPKEAILRQNRERQLRRAIELRSRGPKVVPEGVIKTMETNENDPNKWLGRIPADILVSSRRRK